MKGKMKKGQSFRCSINSRYLYGFRNSQRGALLIGLIVTMVIFSLLGGSMLHIFSSSVFDPVFGNFAQRAYYAAESGMRFAVATYRNDSTNGRANFFALNGRTLTFPNNGKATLTIPNSPTAAAATTTNDAGIRTDKTLVVANATGFPDKNGFFTIQGVTGYFRYRTRDGNTLQMVTGPASSWTAPATVTSPADQVSITSKGFFPLAAYFNMSRTVEYGWVLSGQTGPGVLEPQVLNPTNLVANNPFGNSADLGTWANTTVDGGTALTVTKVTGGDAEAVLGFSSGATNPFQVAWTGAGQYLSYDAQVKIATIPAQPGYVAGLTFRSQGTNPGHWDQYGLSFAKYDAGSSIIDTLIPTLPTGLYNNWSSTGIYILDNKVAYPPGSNTYFRCSAATCPTLDNKGKPILPSAGGNWSACTPPMILLWTRNSNVGSGADYWLAYKLLMDEPSTGVVNANGDLKDWSTISLRVVEGASLRFSSGATGFVVGDMVTGATSGAKGVVFKKIQTTDGQDVVILNNVTGTFTTGENISSPNQSVIANVEYRTRDNYIWAMFGDTSVHGTADSTAINDTRKANLRVLDDSVITPTNIDDYIHWPPVSIGEWSADNDYFKLSAWNVNLNKTANGDASMLIMGTGNESGAILRTNIWVTGGYTAANFPYEMGWHTLGDASTHTYFDDLSINFPGQTAGGTSLIIPIQQ